jgi:hypothetical protein
MDSTPSRFPYKPLLAHRDEIRLVRLRPGRFHDPIYCDIYHVSLQPDTANPENVKYTALSYAWGDPGKTKNIRLAYCREDWVPAPTVRAVQGVFVRVLVVTGWLLMLPTYVWMGQLAFMVHWIVAWAINHYCKTRPGQLHALTTSLFDHMAEIITVLFREHVQYLEIPVTTNLESGLRHMRYRIQSRILWIDALCINQQDMREREKQVRMMGSLYKSAASVHVWLGTADGNSAVQAAVSCAVNSLQSYNSNASWSPSPLEVIGMQILASKPWWTRVWILQEVTLAPSPYRTAADSVYNPNSLCSPVMQCGDILFEYRSFLYFMLFCMLQMRAQRGNLPDGFVNNDILRSHFHVKSFYDVSAEVLSLPEQLLAYMGWTSGQFFATNPRDKVYGLLGLPRGSDSYNSLSNIPLEYGKDVRDVYLDVALFILNNKHPQARPLALLEHGPGKMPGIPSWVPGWEGKTSKGFVREETPKSHFKLDVVKGELTLRALPVGSVVAILDMPHEETITDADALRKNLLMMEREIDKVLQEYGLSTTARRMRVQWFRTLLDYVFCREAPPRKEAQNGLDPIGELVAAWMNSANDSEDEEVGSRTLKTRTVLHDFLEFRGTENGAQPPASDVSTCSVTVPKMRRFFRRFDYLVVGTELFGYLFEDDMAEWRRGDRLVMLPDCACALGLRADGNGWKYMYRVALLNFSDLGWKQRKKWFDGERLEDVTLV